MYTPPPCKRVKTEHDTGSAAGPAEALAAGGCIAGAPAGTARPYASVAVCATRFARNKEEKKEGIQVELFATCNEKPDAAHIDVCEGVLRRMAAAGHKEVEMKIAGTM